MNIEKTDEELRNEKNLYHRLYYRRRVDNNEDLKEHYRVKSAAYYKKHREELESQGYDIHRGRGRPRKP
jgi:hypothetical protein